MPDVLLPERPAKRAAVLLEMALNVYRQNGQAPDQDTREAAALLATADPLTAVRLPLLLAAAGPQAAAAVKAEARRIAASRLDRDGPGSPISVTAALSASEAARIADVSSQAIRAACADGRLAACKSAASEWQIAPAALEEWMVSRHAA